jgi:hypothetical protein
MKSARKKDERLHVVNLRLAFEADNPRHAERKVRSVLRWLWRCWGMRCTWRDESKQASDAGQREAGRKSASQ